MPNPEKLDCKKCQKTFPFETVQDRGVHFINHSVDMIPAYIFVCEDCSINLAVDIISGKIPFVNKLIKMGMKKG
jgi:hypothetical protein